MQGKILWSEEILAKRIFFKANHGDLFATHLVHEVTVTACEDHR